MFASEDTLKRIRAQADAYAANHACDAEFAVLDVAALDAALRAAYLTGADAGYTAAKAEGRES